MKEKKIEREKKRDRRIPVLAIVALKNAHRELEVYAKHRSLL